MSVKDVQLVFSRMNKVWLNCNDNAPRTLVALFSLLSDAKEWANLAQAKEKLATYEVEEGSNQ